MMSPQQQQILTRSALAAGVTLAIGLAAIGFVPGRTAGPVAPAAPEASAGAVDARAITDAAHGFTPDRTVLAGTSLDRVQPAAARTAASAAATIAARFVRSITAAPLCAVRPC